MFMDSALIGAWVTIEKKAATGLGSMGHYDYVETTMEFMENNELTLSVLVNYYNGNEENETLSAVYIAQNNKLIVKDNESDFAREYDYYCENDTLFVRPCEVIKPGEKHLFTMYKKSE